MYSIHMVSRLYDITIFSFYFAYVGYTIQLQTNTCLHAHIFQVYAIDEKNDVDITDHVYDNQGAGDYDTPPTARKVGSGLDHTYTNAR